MIGRALAAVILSLAGAASAAADEVKVLAAGAAFGALVELAPVFEQRTGHRIVANFDAVGALRERVAAGEQPAIVILSGPALDALAAAGRLVPGSRRYLGQSGVALAALRSAPVLDVSTPERLRSVLLDAPSLAFGDPSRGNAAGSHLRSVLDQLGITEAIMARAVIKPFGIDGLRAVVAGEAVLAIGQASEITANPNLQLVGMLPDPLQLWTPYGIAAVGRVEGATAELLDFLASPTAVEAFRRIGFAR